MGSPLRFVRLYARDGVSEQRGGAPGGIAEPRRAQMHLLPRAAQLEGVGLQTAWNQKTKRAGTRRNGLFARHRQSGSGVRDCRRTKSFKIPQAKLFYSSGKQTFKKISLLFSRFARVDAVYFFTCHNLNALCVRRLRRRVWQEDAPFGARAHVQADETVLLHF